MALHHRPGSVIIQLDPGDQESISILVDDQRVLFFLTKGMQLYPGDGKFNHTLKRGINHVAVVEFSFLKRTP
jgi:hypothetical protein